MYIEHKIAKPGFIILLAKQFIVRQHYADARISYVAFLPMLIRHFDMEKQISRSDAEKEKCALDGHHLLQ